MQDDARTHTYVTLFAERDTLRQVRTRNGLLMTPEMTNIWGVLVLSVLPICSSLSDQVIDYQDA